MFDWNTCFVLNHIKVSNLHTRLHYVNIPFPHTRFPSTDDTNVILTEQITCRWGKYDLYNVCHGDEVEDMYISTTKTNSWEVLTVYSRVREHQKYLKIAVGREKKISARANYFFLSLATCICLVKVWKQPLSQPWTRKQTGLIFVNLLKLEKWKKD